MVLLQRMSLTGGGGHEIGGGGGGGDGPRSSCEQLTFVAALSSPNPKLLAHVKVEWALRVETRSVSGTKVAVVISEGEVLGTITTPEALRLIDCIDEGHTFYAHVLEIKGGLCRVRIRHS